VSIESISAVPVLIRSDQLSEVLNLRVAELGELSVGVGGVHLERDVLTDVLDQTRIPRNSRTGRPQRAGFWIPAASGFGL